MKQNKLMFAVSVVAFVFLGLAGLACTGMSKSDAALNHQKATAAKSTAVLAAKFSLAQAIDIATKKVPGQAISAKIEKENGAFFYEVKLLTKDKNTKEVIVDMQTGNVVKIENDDENNGNSDKNDDDNDEDDDD